MKNVHLVIIDGQEDFLSPTGSLYVQNADKEAVMLAEMIDRLGSKINHIHPTLDSHHPLDIAHPRMWKDENGDHPAPFTIITEEDVVNRKWRCTLLGYWNSEKKITYQDKCLSYVKELKINGSYDLCIWPEHCLIGSPGHNVYSTLREAYSNWIDKKPNWLDYVTKGDYPFTEHYSAILADVPEPTEPKTQVNADFLTNVDQADIVVLAGWAGSHCLANTGRDIVKYAPNGENEILKKTVLLTDLCAPVQPDPPNAPGLFTKMREDFLTDMKTRGMTLMTSKELLT